MGAKPSIELSLEYSGEVYRVKTFENEYEDLRLLIIDHAAPENFGECGGMGRCATCMVTISSMSKAGKPEISLACQLPVNDELANKVINIL